jgi:hypothetical protein
MTQICIIGDSHVAALRSGWHHAAAEFPDLQITFFAGMNRYMGGLERADGALIATTTELRQAFERTSNGLFRIENSYDHFLLCGLGARSNIAIETRKALLAAAGAKYPGDTEFVGAIRDALEKTQMARVLALLRQITKAPVGIIAAPFAEYEKDAAAINAAQIAKREKLLGDFNTACRALAEENQAIFLPQPDETRDISVLNTKAEFSHRSLKAKDQEPDPVHKNAAYGAIALRAALRTMTSENAISEHLVVNAGTSLTRC